MERAFLVSAAVCLGSVFVSSASAFQFYSGDNSANSNRVHQVWPDPVGRYRFIVETDSTSFNLSIDYGQGSQRLVDRNGASFSPTVEWHSSVLSSSAGIDPQTGNWVASGIVEFDTTEQFTISTSRYRQTITFEPILPENYLTEETRSAYIASADDTLNFTLNTTAGVSSAILRTVPGCSITLDHAPAETGTTYSIRAGDFDCLNFPGTYDFTAAVTGTEVDSIEAFGLSVTQPNSPAFPAQLSDGRFLRWELRDEDGIDTVNNSIAEAYRWTSDQTVTDSNEWSHVSIVLLVRNGTAVPGYTPYASIRVNGNDVAGGDVNQFWGDVPELTTSYTTSYRYGGVDLESLAIDIRLSGWSVPTEGSAKLIGVAIYSAAAATSAEIQNPVATGVRNVVGMRFDVP